MYMRLLYKFRCEPFEYIGQTRSSSTSQLSPNSSFSASSPNQSAYLSPERTYPSSTSLGASGSFNNSYDGGSKVSWTVGGSESVDGKVQNEPPSDSVTLQAGINQFTCARNRVIMILLYMYAYVLYEWHVHIKSSCFWILRKHFSACKCRH